MNKSIFVLVWLFVFLSVVSAGDAIFVQHQQSDFNEYYQAEGRLSTYYPILSEKDQCQAREDLIIQVAPGGCQPAVVRSDLLAEQNVPVFCQLDAIKLNPLINVERIKNIRFSLAEKTEGVVGVGFHPARAALRTDDVLLGSPVESDIGYAVVVLKRNADEDSLPESVNVNLRARVDYDADNAFGVGKSEFLLTSVNDVEWEKEKLRQSFFNGEYYLRLREAEANRIAVDIYRGDDRINSVVVEKGKSEEIYLPGAYCRFGISIHFDKFVSANPIARLNVGGDVIDVYKGSRFSNNKCVVESVIYEGIGTGSASIKCGGSESFDLKLKPMDYAVDEEVEFIVGTDGYEIGKFKIESFSDGQVKLAGRDGLANASSLKVVDESKLYEAVYSGEIEKYFKNSVDTYVQIVDEHPNTVSSEALGSYYGESALDNAITLAKDFNKKRTQLSLMEKYQENYPEGYGKFKQDYSDLFLIDSSDAVTAIGIDSDVKTIRLLDVYEPDKKSKANFNLGTSRINLEQGQPYSFKEGTSTGVIVLENVNSNGARVSYRCSSVDENKPQIKTLKQVIKDENDVDSLTVCSSVLKLTGIQLEEFVKVRVEPTVKVGGETNLTVNIGIEKRAFELTPEKAEMKIKNLEDTIDKWSSVNENLGKFVKGMKAACFATSGVLTIKNFFSGLSGGAIARQRVMSGKGGWTEKCAAEAKLDGITVDACFNKHSSEIENQVDLMKGIINQQDQVLEKLSDGASSDQGFLLDKWVDSGKVSKEYVSEELASQYGTVKVGQEEVMVDSLLIPKNDGGDVYLSPTEARDMKFWLESRKDAGLADRANAELSVLAGNIKDRIEFDSDSKDDSALLSGFGLGGAGVESIGGPVAGWRGGYVGVEGDKIGMGTAVKAQAVEHESDIYFVTLDDDEGVLTSKDVYYRNGTKVKDVPLSTVITGKYSSFEKSDEQLRPVVINNPKVKYFASEPYKDMPAIVPFDVQGGWYAATRQTLPAFSNIKAFESSGRVASFWLCHVGKDGEIDFSQGDLNDDKCGQFNANTGQSERFYGLSPEQTKIKVNQARTALEEAARARGRTGDFISVLGNNIGVGGPAVDSSGIQCQDFMSPKDCQLLFNVCDPVICPTSRCDFGGKYKVDDVIQSGIVGSALLCLPNSIALGGDVAIPVCLTGIHAGVEGYVSILEQHKACLEENIETGEYVGICDEIYSVYSCEFFWRQAAPLAKVLLPKAIEFAYTGGRGQVRGGGEYMTVQNAWSNTEKSIDYFTNYYAGNSFDAFKARSVEEAGGEFCKSFISAKAPTDFETLIEPDSPVQFHSFFSEIPYSDATVPATGQYKVFYHVFSGNDRGTSYSIYLKDPPESSFYYSTPRIQVANGYVNRGESVSETKDFTAPTGYKQLCVNVNGKEECGFKQVSTSFLINSVSDSIVSDELKRTGISSETECISGGTNPASFLNPNLGEAAQEAIDPAVYNRGISRVCATDNPGSATDPQRFVDMGHCGNERIRCWLDRTSVENAIGQNNLDVTNSTFEFVDQKAREAIVQSGDYLIDEEARVAITDIKGDIHLDGANAWNGDVNSAEALIIKVNQVLNKMYLSSDIAKVMLEKGRIYEAVARKLFNDARSKTIVAPTNPADLVFVDDSASLEDLSGEEEQIVNPMTTIPFENFGFDIPSKTCEDGISQSEGVVEVKTNGDITERLVSMILNNCRESGLFIFQNSLFWNIGSEPERIGSVMDGVIEIDEAGELKVEALEEANGASFPMAVEEINNMALDEIPETTSSDYEPVDRYYTNIVDGQEKIFFLLKNDKGSFSPTDTDLVIENEVGVRYLDIKYVGGGKDVLVGRIDACWSGDSGCNKQGILDILGNYGGRYDGLSEDLVNHLGKLDDVDYVDLLPADYYDSSLGYNMKISRSLHPIYKDFQDIDVFLEGDVVKADNFWSNPEIGTLNDFMLDIDVAKCEDEGVEAIHCTALNGGIILGEIIYTFSS